MLCAMERICKDEPHCNSAIIQFTESAVNPIYGAAGFYCNPAQLRMEIATRIAEGSSGATPRQN